jgi:hypothetical protein
MKYNIKTENIVVAMSLIDEIESMYNQSYSDIVMKTLEEKFEAELSSSNDIETAEKNRQREEVEIKKKIVDLRSSLSKYKNIKNFRARVQNEKRHEKRKLIYAQIHDCEVRLEDIQMERGE